MKVRMTSEEFLCATALASWKQVIARADAAVAAYTDEQLDRQVAPGKNRVRYLVGHLTAVHDRMFTLLRVGERLYPQFDAPYLENPDRTLPDPVNTDELKAAWAHVSTGLTTALEKLTPVEWLERHTSVSEEDFAKEPLRNRLAVLLSRTNHLSFHLGQAILAK